MERIVYCNVYLDKIKDNNRCITCNYITCNYITYCNKEECIQTELLKRNRYDFLFDSDCFDTRTCYDCITKHQKRNLKIMQFKDLIIDLK